MDNFQKWFLEKGSEEGSDASIRELVDSFGSDDFALSSEGFERFREKIGPERRAMFRRRAFRILERAAAILLLPVALLSVFLLTRKGEPVQWAEVYTQSGQTSTVTLPDGSTLRLSPQSRLVYPLSFEEGMRKVFLQGEAYADIVHMEDHPFEICSGEVTVSVLGTEFNFSSYVADSECELALVDGSVRMTIDGKDADHTIQMKTGEIVRYDRESGNVDRQRFSVDTYLANDRRDGLQFPNRKMGDIAHSLERKFGSKIVIEDNAIAEERFFASFINGEDLPSILQTLNTQNHMRITNKGNTYYLSLK